MAAVSDGTKRVLGLTAAAIGIVANVVGIAGAFGDWGSSTTEVVLSVEPAAAADAVEETTTTEVPAETAEEFLTALAAAIASGDTAFLTTHLHPEVAVRYGADQCAATVATYLDPTYAIEVLNVSEPADYQWVTDSLTTVIPETLSVEVLRTADGVQASATVHITEIDGAFTWFTDCGAPV